MRERFIRCECHIEGLRLTRFEDDDEDLYVAMWEDRHYGGRVPWRQRWRHIWRVIRTGRPYEDEVVLNRQAAQDVARFIVGAPDDATLSWTTKMWATTWGSGTA